MLKKLEAIGFSDKFIRWFRSYFCERIFFIEIENQLSDYGKVSCGVPQCSILGPVLFLVYVNNMPQAVKSNLFLYADDSCLMYQHRDVEKIEKQLNKDFENVCHWFVDNKLSIHFGGDKTKSILFASKRKIKSGRELNVKYKNIKIKQHSQVSYLASVLDETLSEEPMALKTLNKIDGKLKFLYRKNKFLTPTLRRMLCNAIIQPHFDYAYSAWYPNLNEKLKKKIQIAQNKCIQFCLKLDKIRHISSREFESINWLPVYKRVHQCINAITFKFVSNACPHYLNEVYDYAPKCRIESISNFAKLRVPFCKTNMGQKSLSYIGSSLWNNLPRSMKKSPF